MVCFWRRRVHDKSATEYGAGWFTLRRGEVALYVKNSFDFQWARSGEKRYHHAFPGLEGYFGMRDLTKIQCGIRENIDGMRDLTKRQCGIRENVDRCAIWLLAGKRNLPKGTDADWERKWCSGWRWQKFGMCCFRENGAEIRDQQSPFLDPILSDRRVVKTYRHALFVV